MSSNEKTVSVVVPAGVLGAGIRRDQVEWGIRQGAVAVAVDAGSTDSGPSCLATGVSKMSRDAVRRDIKAMMEAATPAGIPILIGTCGTSGTDIGVDWTRDIVIDIAREMGVAPKIALLYSEQSQSVILDKIDRGQITPLSPTEPLDPKTVRECAHIVALMGPEPYIAAMKEGADIILGGRTTDTAVIASAPLMLGAGAGAAWHAAKTAECGGLCTVNPRDGGVLITVGDDYFDVRPLAPENTVTPETISAHMLYENSDPFRLYEPGCVLDVTDAVYSQTDETTVRVTGSRCEPMPYTMKLEGASVGPFQTLMIIGIEDPSVLKEFDFFLESMTTRLNEIVRTTFPDLVDYDLSFRPYGYNAVSGLPRDGYVPSEVGLMMVVTAPTQDLATRIAKALNPQFFHFPLRRGIPLPSYAFPFSPAEIERGQVYEFKLNHVMEVGDPMECVRTKYVTVRNSEEA